MVEEEFIWQCKCGYIEHTDLVPDDCPKCLRVGKFNPVPEDQISEKVEQEVLAFNMEEYDEY